jgi:hypothetical protein
MGVEFLDQALIFEPDKNHLALRAVSPSAGSGQALRKWAMGPLLCQRRDREDFTVSDTVYESRVVRFR